MNSWYAVKQTNQTKSSMVLCTTQLLVVHTKQVLCVNNVLNKWYGWLQYFEVCSFAAYFPYQLHLKWNWIKIKKYFFVFKCQLIFFASLNHQNS